MERSFWRRPHTHSGARKPSRKLRHRAGGTHTDAELPEHKNTRKIYLRMDKSARHTKRMHSNSRAYRNGCTADGLHERGAAFGKIENHFFRNAEIWDRNTSPPPLSLPASPLSFHAPSPSHPLPPILPPLPSTNPPTISPESNERW